MRKIRCKKHRDILIEWDKGTNDRIWSEPMENFTDEYIRANYLEYADDLLCNFDRTKYKTVVIHSDPDEGICEVVPYDLIVEHKYTVMSLEVKDYLFNCIEMNDEIFDEVQCFVLSEIRQYFERLGYKDYLEGTKSGICWMANGIDERIMKLEKTWYSIAFNKAKRKLF